MKISLISTLSHNPGDEFIRLGVEHLLRRVYPGSNHTVIHKHDPRTLYSGFQQRKKTPHRLVAPILYNLYAGVYGRSEENYLESADLVVFAGTPFIWRAQVEFLRSTCANAEWVGATWRRLFDSIQDKPVLNLAAGSSVTNAGQFDEILVDQSIGKFLRQAVGRTKLTTARDQMTQKILESFGLHVPIIPCASLMAAKGAHLPVEPAEYVAINVMQSAAHSWRGQRGNSAKWEETIKQAVRYIEKRHPILFVSHSQNEDDTAAKWFPQHPRFNSKDPIALLKAYSKAKYGVCNRVHAGAAVASFGRPCLVVGGDSRINLIQQFGLPAFDHRDLDGPTIVEHIKSLETDYSGYVDRLNERAEVTEHSYIQSINALRLTM